MVRLISAEILKLRTTQVWFWLLLAAVAISSLAVIVPIANNNEHNGYDVASMFGSAGAAYIVLFVLGVLGITTEFRYQTITPTVLATPSRWAIVTAKMIAYALVGIAYAIVCLIVQLAIAIPWLSAKHVHYSLLHYDTPRALIGVLVVLALFGIVGLGIGALLKNQIVAVSVGVVFLILLQNLIGAIPKVKHVFPYLPGGAAQAVEAVTHDDHYVNGVHLLSVPAAIVVLLLWAFIPAIVGASFTLNRDIT